MRLFKFKLLSKQFFCKILFLSQSSIHRFFNRLFRDITIYRDFLCLPVPVGSTQRLVVILVRICRCVKYDNIRILKFYASGTGLILYECYTIVQSFPITLIRQFTYLATNFINGFAELFHYLLQVFFFLLIAVKEDNIFRCSLG